MNNDLAELIAVAVAAAIAEQLPKILAAVQSQQVPERKYWDAKIIGHHLGMSAENFLGRYACRPDCPRPSRLPFGEESRGHPLWEPNEIMDWVRRNKEDFSGRRRQRKSYG